MQSETVWSFETARFTVRLEAVPEETDPADSFEFEKDIEAVRNGDVLWFAARVVVETNGHEVGSDSLEACAYRSMDEFTAGHRDPDSMNRNSSVMRAARGRDVAVCHYFPDMVREAIADARRTLGGDWNRRAK